MAPSVVYFPLEGDPGDLEGEVEFETIPNKAEELPLTST